jgi:hypothetical protein
VVRGALRNQAVYNPGMAPAVLEFEKRLRADFDWGLRESSMHFSEQGGVQESMRRIAKRLDDLQIPYAIVGGMALYYHGYERYTTDVDLLVTPEDLKRIHEQLEGLGYVPPFAGSKHLRDTANGVKVEFLTTGDYPGDGKPKEIAFPNPVDVRQEIKGLWFLSLPTLINLKLASGISNPLRAKDIGDVQELMKLRNLDESLVPELHPYVRAKYVEIVELIRNNPVIPE